MTYEEKLDAVFFRVLARRFYNPEDMALEEKSFMSIDMGLNETRLGGIFEDLEKYEKLCKDDENNYIVCESAKQFIGFVETRKRAEAAEKGKNKTEKIKNICLVISIVVAVISIIVNGALYLDKNFDKQLIELQKQQLQQQRDSMDQIINVMRDSLKQPRDTSKK